MTFAAKTRVPVAQTRGEIEAMLQRRGASQFVSGWDEHGARIAFVLDRLSIRFDVALPLLSDPKFSTSHRGTRRRSAPARQQAWEQACRARWRALLLVIKAKLEAVDSGISTVQHEFLAWTVVPGSGETVLEAVQPKLLQAAETGEPPRLLDFGGQS